MAPKRKPLLDKDACLAIRLDLLPLRRSSRSPGRQAAPLQGSLEDPATNQTRLDQTRPDQWWPVVIRVKALIMYACLCACTYKRSVCVLYAHRLPACVHVSCVPLCTCLLACMCLACLCFCAYACLCSCTFLCVHWCVRLCAYACLRACVCLSACACARL